MRWKNAKYASMPEHYVQKHTTEASMHFPGDLEAMRKTDLLFILSPGASGTSSCDDCNPINLQELHAI